MKLDSDMAEGITELMHHPRFSSFIKFMDMVNDEMISAAINGKSKDPADNPDVLRGRAQAVKIIMHEINKAPVVAQKFKPRAVI